MDNHHDMPDPQEGVPLPSLLFSRRQILKLGGISIAAAAALAPVLARSAAKPLIIMEKAHGIVIADPATCVGCGRCELACTEFNEGKAAPSLSRIKVDRNINFGPDALLAWREGQGAWGSGLIVQDLCKQCPHPVPCANICPEDAIAVAPSSGARMINVEKCTGCRICLKACPWEMISFDRDSRKATKCHLCNGKPKCVEACPAESLSYVPWRDLTGKIPPRVSTVARPLGDRAAACFECHLPGQRKSASLDTGVFPGGAKPGVFSSRPGSTSSWIDRLGTIFLPVVGLLVLVHGAVRAVVKR
jgi:Fe-S-cluster-containing dehydrogenase component